MTKPMTVVGNSGRLIEQASELYQDLTDELLAAIERLKSTDFDGDAKTRSETIRAHRKSLQTILEMQAEFLRQADKGGQAHDLNLEAARKEIFSRLDRLAAADED